MQFQKRLAISLVVAIILFFSTMFFSFIPCKIFPGPLGSEPYWSTCTLSAQPVSGFQTSRVLFLGQEGTLRMTYIATLGFLFAISFAFLTIFLKSKNK